MSARDDPTVKVRLANVIVQRAGSAASQQRQTSLLDHGLLQRSNDLPLLSPSPATRFRSASSGGAAAVPVPCYLFDPLTGVLEGYALDTTTRSYVRQAPEPGGDLSCPVLGLRVGVRRGTYQGVETDWLRWLDAEGRSLPTDEEIAREAEARARETAQRAAEQVRRGRTRSESSPRRWPSSRGSRPAADVLTGAARGLV